MLGKFRCRRVGDGTFWSVSGFGVDPSLQIDVLSELQLGGSTEGVRQVPGLHNGSKAFLFTGTAAPAPQLRPWPSGPGAAHGARPPRSPHRQRLACFETSGFRAFPSCSLFFHSSLPLPSHYFINFFSLTPFF